MRKTWILTVVAAAACMLAISVPAASAGWEGRIDFDTLSDNSQMVDKGPKGPSAGDSS